MGKKDGNKKRKAEEALSEDEVDDAELQAEMAAVLAARAEKKDESNQKEVVERVTMYNKDGMLKCIEELDTGLPFSETMVVCEFTAAVTNENDDIEREVSIHHS